MRKKARPSRYVKTDDGTPRAQEERIARRTGGKRVGGSGASMYSKGDVRDVTASDVEFLVECKQTIHASISVKWEWLRKITAEANAVQKEPMLTIEIKGGQKDPLVDRDWVMVPARVFEQMKGDQ
jgi:Holliday junction resolvase